ncbi:MAG: hypothetical protein VX278_04150 [Myxococcota bacterium]|nr:hypothetical protein [Myxococcota bacterium]
MKYFSLILFLACSSDTVNDDTAQTDTVLDEDSDSEDVESAAQPIVFAASDVDPSSIELTLDWFAIAQDEWFTDDTFGATHNLYFPVYLVITGEDMDATIALEQEYCAHLNDYHAETVAYSRCNYTDPNCENGICLFTEYVTNGGAGIASSRQNDGYHLMIMAAKNPSPAEDHYKRVVLHEVFHIFQLSQHLETDYDVADEIQGRRTGDHDENVPWWMEGVAEYMSILLYAEQEGVSSEYAKQEFRNKIGYHSSDTGTPVIDEYFVLDIELYNIKFDENAMFGYALGAWFVAFLMKDHDEQTMFDFYQNIHAASFEDNFIAHFGKSYREYMMDFEVFLQQDPEQLMSIIP